MSTHAEDVSSSGKTRLLCGVGLLTAAGVAELLVPGTSQVAGMAAGAATGMTAWLGRLAQGIGDSIATNLLEERLRSGRTNALVTADPLVRVTGQAIRRIVHEVAGAATSPPREADAETLSRLAAALPNVWTDLEYPPVDEQAIVHAATVRRSGGAVLDRAAWGSVVRSLVAALPGEEVAWRGIVKRQLTDEAVQRLGARLESDFRKALVAALAADRAASEEIRLRLLGEIHAATRQTHNRTEEVLRLQHGAADAAAEVVRQIAHLGAGQREIIGRVETLYPALGNLSAHLESVVRQEGEQTRDQMQAGFRELKVIMARQSRPRDASLEAESSQSLAHFVSLLPTAYRKGLNQYEAGETLYGRESEIRERVRRLTQGGDRFLSLVGPSGVGKSSFLRAGLIPRLKGLRSGEAWPTFLVQPGDQPLRDLLRAMAEASDLFLDPGDRIKPARIGRLTEKAPDEVAARLVRALHGRNDDVKVVLVIDQFENLLVPVATRDDEDAPAGGSAGAETPSLEEAERFLDFLLAFSREATGRAVLITSIRSASQPLIRQPPWSRLAREIPKSCEFDLYEPERNALREIITSPLEQAGYGWDEELVAALLDDVARETNRHSSPLPLLSLALERIGHNWALRAWKQPDTGMTLTRDLYETGRGDGLRGVLEAHTAELREGLSQKEMERLPELFWHLVRINEKRQPIRRRVPNEELALDPILHSIVDELVTYKLIVTGRDASELIHDVLFEGWPELSAWLEDHRDDLFDIIDVLRNAEYWKARDYVPDRLVPRERLADVNRLFANVGAPIGSPEQRMLVDHYLRESRKRVLLEAVSAGSVNEVRAIVRGDRGAATTEPADEAFFFAMYPDESGWSRAEPDLQSSQHSFNVEAAPRNESAGPRDKSRSFQFEKSHVELRTERGFTVAHYAALADRPEVLSRLTDLGLDPFDLSNSTESGSTICAIAAYGGSRDALSWLLARAEESGGAGFAKSEAERPNRDGMTPAMLAAADGFDDVLHVLLDAHIDVEQADRLKRTSLHWAALGGHTECIDLLLDRGARLDARDKWKQTPLHYAAMKRDNDATVQHLLKRGADPLAQDNDGELALHVALKNAHFDIARTLVASMAPISADPERAASLLRTALDVGDGQTAATLAEYGAELPYLATLRRDSPAGARIERPGGAERVALVERHVREGLNTAWRDAPFLTDQWRELSAAEAAREIVAVSEILPPSGLAFDRLDAVRERPLPFYPGAFLVELRASASRSPTGCLTAIRREGEYTLLDGGSRVIHQLNESVPIDLGSVDRVTEYLRFFTASIQGEAGVFAIVESVDDVGWLNGTDSIIRDTVRLLLKELELVAMPAGATAPGLTVAEDRWRFRASVLYGTDLFHSEFAINASGVVEMIGDEQVASGVPAAAVRFQGVLRVRSAPQIESFGFLADPRPAGEDRATLPEAWSSGTDSQKLAGGASMTAPSEPPFSGGAAEWPSEAILDGDWNAVGAEEATQALTSLADILMESKGSIRVTHVDAVRRLALPFLPGAFLYEARAVCKDVPIGCFTFLYNEDHALLLDGSTDRLTDVRTAQGFVLGDAEAASAYCRLYCRALQAGGSCFSVLDNSSRLWLDPAATLVTATELRQLDMTIHVEPAPRDLDAVWRVGMLVHHRGSLSRVTFDVSADGAMSIAGETKLLDGAPLLREFFTGGCRIAPRQVSIVPVQPSDIRMDDPTSGG